MQQITDQIQAVREQLDMADRDPLTQRQIGRILVALGTLTDVVERIATESADWAVNRGRPNAQGDHLS